MQMRAHSPGAPGELVLEGHTLARGYLGQPEKTAAAFIDLPPPWLQELRPGSRFYKTGDMVQYEVDGTIRYIGRIDTQVKIRGQRVEFGEIEHQIRWVSSSAGVRDVVVEQIAIPGHEQTGRVLVAFICDHPPPIDKDNKKVNGETRKSIFGIPSPEQRAESRDISQALVKHLPSYMIPSVFIPLTYMPVMPSGKADRRLLRDEAAVLTRQELGAYFTRHVAQRSPQTLSEQILQGVVAEVLHLEANEVGMDDDFFQLGGDSIIAIRLVSRARESGFSFRVTDVFLSPKLSDLALLRSNESAVEGTSDTALYSMHYLGFADRDDMIDTILASKGCSVSKSNVCDVLPVTQAAKRMLFQSPEYWGVVLQGPIHYDRLQWACTELVHRHDILRSVFLPHQDRFLQVVLDHIDTRIQHQGFRANIDGFLDQHRREDHISIPTIDTPVTRFSFVQGPQETQILVVRLSHAQFDGYSLHSLWHDLICLYEGTNITAAAGLSSSHIQQWIIVQQQEEAFKFWKDVLDGPTLTRIDRATFGECNNARHHQDSRLITATCRVDPGASIPHSITPATLSKAAWAFLLSRLTGQDSVVFAQTSNGRNHASPDAHHLVGMCLNHIPVRVSLNNPASTAYDLMQFLQQQHRDSLPYDLLDFDTIVDQATPWPKGTMYQSNLLHQNLDPDVPFTFGEARALVSCSYEWPKPPDEILIESRPLPDGGLQLTIDVSNMVLSQRHANSVIEKLGRLVEGFSKSPHEPLSKLAELV